MAKQIFDDNKFTDVKLPSGIRPVHYILELKPNFDDFTFKGHVSVAYNTSQEIKLTNSIVLHANELQITEGNVGPLGDTDTSTGKGNQLVTVTYSKISETATLEFQETIPWAGRLNLKFTGTMNDKLKGFYRTSFMIDDTKVYAGTTQFAATDARLCFPCWDEPEFKASFCLSLIFDKYITINGKQYERQALSNTCESSRSGPDNETVVKFTSTPIMSTYLLAFAIGPFEYIEGTDQCRPVRIYTTPGKKEHGRFALEVACKALPYFENYFDIKYPLPKMDLIAIPDFALGAMENWGLVMYRETCLLVDPENTATSRKQFIAIIVAHELSHQWFGNLVTMQWWTHLWLNEGFASFMEYLCVDYIFPEYDIWSQFLTDTYSRALNLDALHNSHPIEVPVKHPSEIDEIFDDISYSKGAAVIRMLYDYIGDASFRKGMKEYLTKFAYRNATTEDLWDCLEEASGQPVKKIMSTWTSQKGFPWLSVEHSHVSSGMTKLCLSQSKFSASGQLLTDETDTKWLIPIKAIFGADPTDARRVCLLEDKQFDFVSDKVGDSWVKLNAGTVGLYRTAYTESMTEKLWPAILDKTMPPMDRFGLQNDYFALCQAGKVRSVDFLKLLQSFREETEYTVWASIDHSLGRLSILLSNTDYREKFHKFGCHLMNGIFERLTWDPKDGEKHTDTMTRALVLNRLVTFGEQTVIAEAKRRYVTHANGTCAIPADLRESVYKAVSVYGDDALFEDLFNIYRTHELQEEKNRAAIALGYCKGSDRSKKVIEFALSDEVRDQDKISVLGPIGETSPTVGWKMLQDNKDLLRKRYETSYLLARLIKNLTQNFTTEAMAQEMAHFFEQNKFPGAERTIQQSIETVELNAKWLARDGAAMREFLIAQ